MEISVASILQSPQAVTHYSFREQFPLHENENEEKLLEPVVGEFDVTRVSGRIVQVQGSFQTRLRMTCDRCGEHFDTPVEFTVDEALEVTDEPILTTEVEEAVSATGQFDATDLIRQDLLLSLPSRRLCGCEPVNTTPTSERLDPRWAALRSIHQEPNGKP